MLKYFSRLLQRIFPRSLGARGERLAARHVRFSLHYRIVARNVLCPGGELDIIAIDGKDIVFIEVRTRSSEDFGAPELTIRAEKKRFIAKAARYYLRTRRVRGLVPRCDVIGIVWPKKGTPVIRHHRAVFGIGR